MAILAWAMHNQPTKKSGGIPSTSDVPIPVSPRAVYGQNVLVNVLCQLQFPPVLSISTSDPAVFQERVRQSYPLYRREEGVEVPPELRELIAKLKPLAGIPDIPRHVFSTTDGSRSIYLTRDFVAVEEKRYTRWENFEPAIAAAIAALNEVYQTPFFTRIGMRYQDLVEREKIPAVSTTPWPQLINSSLLGALADPNLKDDVEGQLGNVLLRLDDVPGAKVRVQHGLVTTPSGSEGYLFDADFYIDSRSETNNAPHILDAFHRASGNLFRWAITPQLHNALEPAAI